MDISEWGAEDRNDEESERERRLGEVQGGFVSSIPVQKYNVILIYSPFNFIYTMYGWNSEILNKENLSRRELLYLCAQPKFLCALASRVVCARTRAQLRGNIECRIYIPCSLSL